MNDEKEPTSSEWIEVRDSVIHGKGIFAAKDVPKEMRVIEYVGDKVTKAESDKRSTRTLELAAGNPEHGLVYIFEIDKKHDIDGDVDWNTAKFINHSCSPNCDIEIKDGRVWVFALKDIKKGDEISYNYGYDIENYADHPCKCGSKNCVGYIVDEESWGKLRKRLKWKKIKGKRKKAKS